MATITSIGYEGTLRENGWARIMRHYAGHGYAVGEFGDWAVTAVPNTDRTVKIASSVGESWCCGVLATADGDITAQSPSVASGSRWDLIAMRCDWSPDSSAGGGITTVVVVTGTAAMALPTTRFSTPGQIFDAPLALVQYVAGQAQPQQIIDLRSILSGGLAHLSTTTAQQILGIDASIDNRAGGNWLPYAAVQSTIATATSGPSAKTLVYRDASGRSQISTPASASDIANKAYVDQVIAAGTSNVTPNATPGWVMSRDANGRSQVANPSASADIATKGYVDASVSALQSNVTTKIGQVTALLDVVTSPWSEAAGSFGSNPQWLTELTLSYPRPWRWQVVASVDIGTTAAGERWDLGVGYGGSAGSQNANGTFFDGTVGADGVVTFQRFTSAISGVVGAGQSMRIYLQARRAYGTNQGRILSSNRRFTVHVFPA